MLVNEHTINHKYVSGTVQRKNKQIWPVRCTLVCTPLNEYFLDVPFDYWQGCLHFLYSLYLFNACMSAIATPSPSLFVRFFCLFLFLFFFFKVNNWCIKWVQLRSIFTGLLFSSFLLCIASINLNRSAAAAKNLKTEGKFEDKAWEEVKRGNYLDTESEGGRTSQGRESNRLGEWGQGTGVKWRLGSWNRKEILPVGHRFFFSVIPEGLWWRAAMLS